MNSISPTIKYIFTYSEQTVSFLDVQIYLSESTKFKTKLYKIPTDCMTLLHFHFHHLLSSKEGIIYSQALRYNMIISEHILLDKLNNQHVFYWLAHIHYTSSLKTWKTSWPITATTYYPNEHFRQKPKFSPLQLLPQTLANYSQKLLIRIGTQLPMTSHSQLFGHPNPY